MKISKSTPRSKAVWFARKAMDSKQHPASFLHIKSTDEFEAATNLTEGAVMTAVLRSTAVGVFHNRQQAEAAVDDLRRSGFRDDDLGFVGRNLA
jgi:hypothetical protein